MKRLLVLLATAVLASPALVAAPARQDLRVLYVGGSVDWANGTESAIPRDPPPDDPRVAVRMKSFEEMLRRHFSAVTVVHAKDYRQEDSERFDVTVMDGTPPEREPRRDVKDAAGRVVDRVPARYFTEDFDRPVLVIGELGEKLGRRVGLKFDWYCLCLDAHAHSFRAGHPIFQGPFPVRLTMEERPTPEDAFHYEYFRDEPTPKTLPMWRVQTKGYKTDQGFRIGMVARPWGFEDSPDAEYISSGVCAKTLDAVAIGRHGNFLGWGFAASPEYLTAEAQTVLANAICYIAKFNGQGLLARKYHDRRATKSWVKELKHLCSREYHEKRQERDRAHYARMLVEREAAEAKQARGEALSAMERSLLGFKAPPEQTYEQYLAGRYGELFKKHGTDIAAYRRYYDENLPWFYSVAPFYKLEVDEDVKSLGIPNTDPRLLARAIELWERGTDVEKAKRLLTRYTLLDYGTPGEWRAWYEANKARLFFTESGGFVFMVDSHDPRVEGNDYSRRARTQALQSVATGETDDLNPVAAAAAVVDRGDGRRELVVKLRIHPGYHLYSHVAPEDAFIPTEVKVDVPPGIRLVGEMSRPAFRPYNDAGTTGLYTGEILFTQVIDGHAEGAARVTVSYQCCDPHICFPPAEHELSVALN